jgi:asparagine synthase (glutamine-hydrolysing)
MCGFIGCLGESVREFPLDPLRHRGPDASGAWASPDGQCWFGHVRLSIIELSAAGAQPMSSASGRTTIVFNGEIYNHLEVRSRLGGVVWRGHSDTETLVEAWERLGEECLGLLRGMFAFAVYQSQDRSVHLVRDRLGIKPLYFRNGGNGCFSFASEVRTLLRGRRPEPGDAALACYLATGHMPATGEIGEGVRILPPGCILRIDESGDSPIRQWWSLPLRKSGGEIIRNHSETQAWVRSQVEDAVREHLLSDVPVGAFLSGGIDSSIVSLVAARSLGRSLHTFCVGFPDAGFDERHIAREVAARAGSNHTEIEVGPEECQRWAVEAVAAMDLPSADAVNTYIVSKAVREAGLKVALSGLGGDELFCGYPSFTDIPRLALLGRIPAPFAKALISLLPAGARNKLDGAASFDPFTLALLRRRWWSDSALKEAGLDAPIPWPELKQAFSDDLQAISAAEILGYMEPMLLRDSDQMSMAVGLELRVPFLDHRLVEGALAMPGHFKSGKPPKRLLIEAFRDLLPEAVWKRPKQGFALPMDSWMRGPLKEFCRSGTVAARNRLGEKFVDTAWSGFERRNLHWTRLWQIAVLGHYLRN